MSTIDRAALIEDMGRIHIDTAEGHRSRGAAVNVVGLDPSLTGTGIACEEGFSERVITPSATSLRGQLQRMNIIASRVAMRTADGALVVIEAPSFGSNYPGHHAIAGLWWILVATVVGKGCPVVQVAPSSLKKFATGNGRAKKVQMRSAWLEHTGADVADDNRVDALFLRQIGLHLVGDPEAIDLPKNQMAAIEGLRGQLPTSS